MALEDQTFSRKPVFALGPEFFLCEGETIPDYGFCLRFREAERIHYAFDFHYVAVDKIERAETLAHLQAWGVPIQLGALFPAVPDKKFFKRAQQVVVSVEAIHSLEFIKTYRTGAERKNISSIPSEVILETLIDATYNPNPDFFFNSLRRVTLGWTQHSF